MEERFLEILKQFNYSPATFAEKLGVQRSSISHLISGRNKPSFDFMSRLITEFPEINMEWFINGKGTMLKKISPSQANPTLFDMDLLKSKTKVHSPEEKIVLQNDKNMFTNVNSEKPVRNMSVLKIVLFYKDHTWQEFLPAESQ